MFDPEKVRRYPAALIVPAMALGGPTPAMLKIAKVDGVRAEDYDHLLRLYRTEQARAKVSEDFIKKEHSTLRRVL